MITIRQRGFPEAVKVVTGMRPRKQMVAVVRDVTSRLRGFISLINPVDTGAMRDSWTWTAVGLMGQIYISLSAHNPRSGVPVTDYASIVDRRVGLLDAAMAEGERIAGGALTVIKWRR